MKFSEINLDIVSQYLQFPINKENPLEIMEFNMYIDAAKQYVYEYTGLTAEEVDTISYLVPPTLLLISNMVENKTFKSFINISKRVSL